MREARAAVWAACIAVSAALRADAGLENPGLADYYHLGDYYLRTSQYEQAVSNYAAMAAKYPDTREAERGWLKTGEAHYMLMLRALADLERAAAAGAPASETEELRSKADSRRNRAAAAYRRAAAQFPAARAEAHVGLGLLAAARGGEGMQEARKELGLVVDHFPEGAGRAQILLGDIAAAAGDRPGARRAYEEARSRFPEVASLAMLKSATLAFDEGGFAETAGICASIIDRAGIDGAYSAEYRPAGTVMIEAVAKRAAAERALAESGQELKGLSAVAERYCGTNVGLGAAIKKAEAAAHYKAPDDAAALLNGIAAKYPKSVWAAEALACLARIQGPCGKAAETWERMIAAWPQSAWRVEAAMGLAETWLAMAAAEKDEGRRAVLRAKAGDACRDVIAAFPSSPEGARARDFIASRGL
jgi:TolA-binding protein